MQSKAANQPLTIETGQALANTGRWETRQELPVETEILIPDYLPAVFKIVKCLLEPVIMQNSVADPPLAVQRLPALHCVLSVR